MNDVEQLTARQKTMLILVEQHSQGITREELSEQMPKALLASRITVLRDLNKLIDLGVVQKKGRGPSTRYAPRTSGQLLLYYDLPSYFGNEPDARPLTEQDNDDFFEELITNQILFDEERAELDLLNKDFQKRITTREPSILKREQERFTVELAWKSSRIEGNTYSLLETEELIKTAKEAPGHTSSEAQMILNHKTALQRISNERNSFKHLDIQGILQVHSDLTAGLEISSGIRSQPVGITGTNYLPPGNKVDLERLLSTAIDITNSKKSPLEAAIIISALIAYLQPFSDGNKRTARLVGNAVLLAHDYAALSYRSTNEILYKESVLLIDEQHSLYWYKRFFLEQFRFACEKYFR